MDSLAKAIQSNLNEFIEEVVAKEANAAALRVEKAVREKTAEIAARTCQRMTMQPFGASLRIDIDFS